MAGEIQCRDLLIAKLGQGIHQRKCGDMGKMTDGAEYLIVQMRIHGQDNGAGFHPYLCDPLQSRGVGSFRRRQNAACPLEQLIRSGCHSGFFLSRNGMGANKVHPCRHGGFRPFDQGSLHTSYITDDRAGSKTMSPFTQVSLIGINGCRKDHEIRSSHPLLRVSHVSIDRTQCNSCLEILDTPPDADDMIGQGLSPEDHAQRSTDEAHTDNCDMLEMDCHSVPRALYPQLWQYS